MVNSIGYQRGRPKNGEPSLCTARRYVGNSLTAKISIEVLVLAIKHSSCSAMESIDPALEKNRPLAREIVRLLLEAWRLKRRYKDRSEKRAAHRKLYLSLMRQLMHEIGQRSLHDIIMQRITFFNQHFKTLLKIEQFQDLMSQESKPQATTPGCELDHSLAEKGRNSNDNEVNVDKSNESSTQSEYEVKSTDALRSIALYQYDPEQDNEEIFSNIKEVEREEEADVDIETNDSNPTDPGTLINIRAKIENELDGHDDRKDVLEKEEEIRVTDNKELHPSAEALGKKLEPLLVYRDDPDMYERIIAPDIRGKKFKISNDGRCPKCLHKRNVFVILDFLFPMGDMPEICNYLIAKGQAVLWSSQDDSHCKDPPTILCRGKCDSDPAKCGFNLNWSKTDLESIFFFPSEDDQAKNQVNSRTEQTKEGTAQHSNDRTSARSLSDDGSTTKEIQEHPQEENRNDEDDMADFDEGLVDMKHYKSNVSWVVLDDFTEDGSGAALETEDEMIKTMLALSSAKEDWKKGDARLWPDDADGDQESVADSVQIGDPSSGVINEQSGRRSYTFSWDSYGSNPWAVSIDSNKKKTQSPESKLVMITTGKAQVPKLLSPIQPTEVTEENRLEQNEKNDPSEAVPVTNSMAEPTPDLSEGQPKDASTVPSITKEGTGEAAPVSREGSAGKQKPYTAADYPVSKDGTCPYCKSADVVYIIIDYKNDDDDGNEKNDEDLPKILKKLLDCHYAYKMPKDENEPPSFQCRSCTYGFNLDWSSTDLETIFGERLEQAEKEPPGNLESDYGSNASNENDMTYNTHSYGYQMPAGSGYPALYYASPFMSFYPTMGVSSMTYPSFYPTHFMPGYFPSPNAYPGYMPQYPNMPYPGPDGARSHHRGSPWTRRQGASKGRRRDTTDSRLGSDETPSVGKSRESVATSTATTTKKGSVGKLDKDEDNQQSNAAGKGDEPESKQTNAAETNATSEMEAAISDDATVDLKSEEDDVRSKLEEQPAVPGVDPSEDKVVFAPKESIKEPDDSTASENQLLKSEKIDKQASSDVANVADSCLPVVESDVNIASESPADDAISAKESNTLELSEDEPVEKTENVEKKRRRTENLDATDGEKPSVEDEESETVSMRITRRKTRASARARGRGRGRGRGKSKGKAS